MAELNCPYCGSDQIETEAALQSPKSNTSIGRWRIGCGYTMFGIVLVMGIVSLLFRQIWMAGALAIPGMWIALAAFFFAAFLLIATIFAARWDPMNRHICRACGLSWLTEIESDQSTDESSDMRIKDAAG